MSMGFSVFENVKLAELGTRIVNVNEGGIWIWPRGVGIGPYIVVDVEDWFRITAEVTGALLTQKTALDEYTAQEGHNGDDE